MEKKETSNMKYTAFDVETTGFRKYEGDQIFSYVITDWNGNSDVRRIKWTPGTLEFQQDPNFIYLQEYWADTSIAKIMHNAKCDYGFCLANGIHIPSNTEFHDTMLMSQMLQNLAASHALDSLSEAIYKYQAPNDNDIAKEAKKLAKAYLKENPDSRIGLSGYQFVDEEQMNIYQVADGERTMLLYKCFAPKLFASPEMWKDYLNELDLLIATIEEEEHGITVDIRQSKKLQHYLRTELDIVKEKSLEIIGRDVNFNSSDQVARLLTEDLGLKIEHTTSKGKASAAKNVLMDLRDEHPLIDMILKHRAFDKGITMVESYLDLMDPKTQRIHANIKTNQAVTGRQSCSEPNLQNVSREASLRTAYSVPARRCFRADEGHVLFLVDYAGIEFRLIVAESGEDEFIDVMKRGDDVHDVASSCLYNDNWKLMELLMKSPTGVKKPEWYLHEEKRLYAGNPGKYENDFYSLAKTIRKNARDGAKNYEFGISYGGGFGAITASLIGLTDKEKREGHQRFCKRWPRVAYFTPNIIKQIRENGYITTSFGRRLYVRRSEAYAGSNYLIQGSAAGILKRAQVRIREYSRFEVNNTIRPLVPIHDELIIKYPRSLLSQSNYILSDISHLMTFHPEIRVPLEVEWKMTTSNWASAKPFKVEKPQDWKFASDITI